MSDVKESRFEEAARRVLERCDALAACSDDAGGITRLFLSPSMQSAHELVGRWMKEAGLEVQVNDCGNIRGTRGPDTPAILVGSHLDTVINAGRYDGALGVIMGIEISALLEGEVDIPFEVIGFSEEEGVRYSCPYIGSEGRLGIFNPIELDRIDKDGCSMRDAITQFGLDPSALQKPSLSAESIKAFLEVHIEQGPVMARGEESVSIVNSIVGQTRRRFTFAGMAQHAGTCPMDLRKDALAAAAAWILDVENLGGRVPGLVATVGRIFCFPNAPNVVPGEVDVSLDVRHVDDAIRHRSVQALTESADRHATGRGMSVMSVVDLDHTTVHMDAGITQLGEESLFDAGLHPSSMVSGAGHDAAVMAKAVPSGLVFIRSPNGVSHHPDEMVLEGDVANALEVMKNLVQKIHMSA